MQNRVAWRRIVAEGAAIVLSILLAFAIQAWWDLRLERTHAQDDLVALRDDFVATRSELELIVRANEQILEATDTVLALVQGDTAVEVPTGSLVMLTSAATFDPPMGSLNGLLASGRAQFVGARGLQQALNAWPAAVDDLDDKSRLHEAFIYEQLVREMRSIMPFRIVADTRYSVGVRPETIRVLPTAEFRALLAQLRLMVNRSLHSAGGVRKVDELLTTIEEGLKQAR